MGGAAAQQQCGVVQPLVRRTGTSQPYETHETRIQLSIRTKIAQGLLTHEQTQLRDSLWFGYSQQSYWQLFNSNISRPFRATDHEPELTYIYPTDAELPGCWRAWKKVTPCGCKANSGTA